MDNKPTVLDILLTLRNLEELLMDYVEENSPSENRNRVSFTRSF